MFVKMTPRDLPALVAMLALSIVLLAGPATAQNYFPLDPDAVWSYVGMGNPDNTLIWAVTEVTAEHVETHVVESGGAGWSTWLRFAEGEGGDRYFVGQRFDGQAWRSVEPPALYLDAPLYEGQTWSSSHIYNGDTPLDIEHEVRSVAELELLSGEVVTAYELWHREVFAGGAAIYELTEWYVIDRGPVKIDWTLFALSDVYLLDGIVATEASSWTDVKGLFD